MTIGAKRAGGVARTAIAVIAASTLAAGTLVTLSAAPASAGGPNIQVIKTVVGTAPGGTTFSVAFSCGDGSTGTHVYPATGGSNVFGVLTDTTTCTINESATGGAANTAYHCDNNGHVNVTCGVDGKSVTLAGPGGNSRATFTVTNAYSNVFAPPTVTPTFVTPGQAVTVSGTGCTKAVFGGSAATGGTVQVNDPFFPFPVLTTTAAGGTGAWSVTFAVPPGTEAGPVVIATFCNDPVPYPPTANLYVIGAATPVTAPPAFTG